MTLGEMLRAKREDRGMSQRAAAEALGCAPFTYRLWEDDYAEPKGFRLEVVREWLGVDAQVILTALAATGTDGRVHGRKAAASAAESPKARAVKQDGTPAKRSSLPSSSKSKTTKRGSNPPITRRASELRELNFAHGGQRHVA